MHKYILFTIKYINIYKSHAHDDNVFVSYSCHKKEIIKKAVSNEPSNTLRKVASAEGINFIFQ